MTWRRNTPSVGHGLLATAIMTYKIGAMRLLRRLPAGSVVAEPNHVLVFELGLDSAARPGTLFYCDFACTAPDNVVRCSSLRKIWTRMMGVDALPMKNAPHPGDFIRTWLKTCKRGFSGSQLHRLRVLHYWLSIQYSKVQSGGAQSLQWL
jgi:hypothetical protein